MTTSILAPEEGTEKETNAPPGSEGVGEAVTAASPVSSQPNNYAERATPLDSTSSGAEVIEKDGSPADGGGAPVPLRDKILAAREAPEQVARNRSMPIVPTPEMKQWLQDNQERFEFYLLHGMVHDPLRRAAMLMVPVTPEDFRREEYGLVLEALAGAVTVARMMGYTVPTPPDPEYLRTHLEVAVRATNPPDEVVDDAMKLIRELEDPSYTPLHHCIPHYFEAWYGSSRAKKAAREINRVDLPDVRGIFAELKEALTAASQLGCPLESLEFDFDNPLERPNPILKLGAHTICTPGNISNIQGPPKAAKSAVVGAVLAAALKEPWNTDADLLGFTVEAPIGRAVLHFDTEQSRFDHASLVRKAYARAGRNEKVDWLHSYCLTGMEPAMCRETLLQSVEEAAKKHDGVTLIIIDGIGDFCDDTNDPKECFGLVRELHKLAADHDCAILTVLHENPGGNQGKTRGHLGSQLERKAETSLRLAKDSDGITVMWAERARHCYIPKGAGWRFRWCNEARMHVSLRVGDEAAVPAKPDKVTNYTAEVTKALGEEEALSYTDLTKAIVNATGRAASTVKARISEYVVLGLLEKDPDGKYRRPGAPTPPTTT